MAIKDKVVKWFIQNIIVPQQEIIDKPGFIATQFSDKGRQVFLRELFLPESIIVNLEKEIVKKFGKRGKEALYSAGKLFGYSYAARSFFPRMTSSTTKEFENFIYMWIRYAEATSYGGINYTLDLSSSVIKLQLADFMVCPHNGVGYFTTSGSFAGFWSFLVDDSSVEAVQTKCRGRGDLVCEVIAGPKTALKMQNVISSIIIDQAINNDDAVSLNAIHPSRFSNPSFKDLLDTNFFKYESGVVIKGNERHFIIESFAMYFLERELMKLDKSNKMLFDLSFEFGKSMSNVNEMDYEKFIATYLSALGYGDISVFMKNGIFTVTSDYFPWSPMADKITYAYFRGILSGLLTGFSGRTVFLKKIRHSTLQGFLRLDISE